MLYTSPYPEISVRPSTHSTTVLHPSKNLSKMAIVGICILLEKEFPALYLFYRTQCFTKNIHYFHPKINYCICLKQYLKGARCPRRKSKSRDTKWRYVPEWSFWESFSRYSPKLNVDMDRNRLKKWNGVDTILDWIFTLSHKVSQNLEGAFWKMIR